MTIVNRRNAVVGWLMLKAAKVVAKRQAKRHAKRFGGRLLTSLGNGDK
jgi:hypothetical protein